jgi:predicted ATPase
MVIQKKVFNMSKNHWYVITGGPCAGKTTVLRELADRGYRIVEEAARTFIDQERVKGKSMKEIRGDELWFQKQLLKMKRDIEQSLDPEEVTFFDRGIHDSHTYYQLAGSEKDEELDSALEHATYQKVFLFDLLPMEQDYARTDSHLAATINRKLGISYMLAGIPVIQVPVLPVAERVSYILERI